MVKLSYNERTRMSLLFRLCVFSNYALDLSRDYYKIGKVFMLVFMLASFWHIIRLKGITVKRIVLPALFSLFLSCSYFWAVDKSVVIAGAYTQFQYLLLYISVYFAVSYYDLKYEYFSTVVFATVGLAILSIAKYGGILQYFDFMISGRRLGGLMGNENIYGMTFATAVLVLIWYLISKKDRNKIIYIIGIIIFSVFVLSSQSKKALIVIAVGTVLLTSIHYGIKRIWKALLIIAVTGALVFFALNMEQFEAVSNRVNSFFSKTDSSDLLRYQLINSGMRVFWENPLIGCGYDNFRIVSGSYYYTHNNFVELLADLGIVGMTLYYAIFINPLRNCIRMLRNQYDQDIIIYQLLITLMLIDIIIGYGAVQFVEKTAWISLGVYVGVFEHRRSYRSEKLNTVYLDNI